MRDKIKELLLKHEIEIEIIDTMRHQERSTEILRENERGRRADEIVKLMEEEKFIKDNMWDQETTIEKQGETKDENTL